MSNLTEKDINELVSAFPELNRGRKRIAVPTNPARQDFGKAEQGYAVDMIYNQEKIRGYSWVTQVLIEARNHPPHKEALFRLMRPYL